MNRPPLNPSARVAVERIGGEGEPVIVVDDLLADPDGWRGAAARAEFRPIGPCYPGVRAATPPGWAEAVRDGLAPLIGRVFGLDPVPGVLESYFSVVTTPPDRLQPIQRLPHFDGIEAARIAVLVYLSGAEQGGTAFYRQRATGFETVHPSRYPAYEAALHRGVAAHGLPAADYIRGDTPLFEQVARFDARPNRALVYRSRLLHCAAIAPGAALPADPAVGRLSVNSFLFDPPRG